jgi:L-ascorbate metabolism protein UlaG (beta-lactamase superfamily)
MDLGGTRLLTDPLLGPRLGPLVRRGPKPDAGKLAGVDAVLVSHMHQDHLDLRSLRKLRRPIVAPAAAAEFMRRRRLGDVTGLASGQSTRIRDLRVTAVPAEHDGARFGRGSPETHEAVGYLIEGPLSVYFAGDTDLFDGMSELEGKVDVALIPIWGWGPRLGPGHLDPETAADALAVVRPRLAIPIHHATLSLPGSGRRWPWLLTEPAERFVAAAASRAPDVEVRVLAPGETTGIDL